ncbi:MAG: transcriptional repressor LexA [Spirochaetaceae bacterium]|nr:transcriptional repressor LexA [Spirochaetaceae bacterium]RKX89206.1 MAG: repressor LexA [Spirochaetota bacterium]RKX98368.1 MAG: repressor LexA [Spirochaetota bacterium]
MRAPTSRQTEVLDFLKSFLSGHKYPPTIREVAGHFGISVKGAYDHVKALEKKGLIACDNNRSRAIEIIETPADSNNNLVQVPLLGHVAAGMPLFAEENFEGNISMSAMLVGNGKVFALRVEGESMIGAGIMDGDIAVFSQQAQVENGQIVVAMVDEAVTLKRFYKEKNRVRLQAENPAYPPMYTADVRILGRLVTIIRSY